MSATTKVQYGRGSIVVGTEYVVLCTCCSPHHRTEFGASNWKGFNSWNIEWHMLYGVAACATRERYNVNGIVVGLVRVRIECMILH